MSEKWKTVGEILAEPTNVDAYQSGICPNAGPKCHLVSDGQGRFACRTCGTGFVVGANPGEKWTSGDWAGDWPWEG